MDHRLQKQLLLVFPAKETNTAKRWRETAAKTKRKGSAEAAEKRQRASARANAYVAFAMSTAPPACCLRVSTKRRKSARNGKCFAMSVAKIMSIIKPLAPPSETQATSGALQPGVAA
jgi:hypothetical protein